MAIFLAVQYFVRHKGPQLAEFSSCDAELGYLQFKMTALSVLVRSWLTCKNFPCHCDIICHHTVKMCNKILKRRSQKSLQIIAEPYYFALKTDHQ